MSYESTAEPIKLGYLFDFVLPEGYPQEMRDDLTRPFELVFDEGLKQGIIDRPVEIVFREVEGLPKGTVKAVIDAYGELVDEGCLAVFGPAITDNCVPTREAIEQRFQVPAISVTGTEDWLGEWTFSLPMGSMTDEPIFWARPPGEGRAHRGRRCSSSSRWSARATSRTSGSACRRKGIRIVAEELDRPDRAGHRRRGAHAARGEGRSALVHCGFGFGIVLRQPGARGARLGSAALHGHRVPERLDQPGDVERDPRLDRASTSTTRATSSARSSSTSSRRPTGGARSTACRW